MANYGRTIRWSKTVQGFSDALGGASEHLTGWAREWMAEAVRKALDQIDWDWDRHADWERKSGKVSVFGGSHFYPWYSGHLHDSIAGIVSDQHRTVAINYMKPGATAPHQTYKGQVIIGHDWAIQEARKIEKSLHFYPGIAATIVVGVPYAKDVDETSRHAGFIRELNNQFVSKVEDYFYEKAEGYRTRWIVADKKKK